MVGVDGATVPEGAATRPARDDDDLLSGPEWRRHPLDVVRLVLALIALVVGAGLALRHAGTVRSVSVDLVDLVSELPRWLRDLLIGTTQLLAVAVPVVIVVVLVRRGRLLATAAGAAVVAATAMALLQHRIDDAVPHRVVAVNARASWVAGSAFPSGAYLAALTAVVVVLGTVLSRGWRRAAVAGVGVAALSRVITVVAVPLNVEITLALGAVVGSGALAAFGSPRRRASRKQVLAGLASAGFAAVTIEPTEVAADHAQTFVATASDGRRGFVKLLGRDERSADLLFRAIKSLRIKDLDDERPSWSPADLVEHEAFASMLAARRSVPVPKVWAVGTTAGGDGLLAVEVVDGTRLEDLPPEEITDDLLDDAWAILIGLRSQGIAHRWLTAHHLLVGAPVEAVAERERGTEAAAGARNLTVVDFRWASHQADPSQLSADIAMLVVSLSTLAGAERAVASAARALSPAELAAALPLVQPLALPDDLRAATKGNSALLPLVRKQVQDAAGGATYKLADIERLGIRRIVSVVGGVVASYTLLSFASNWSDIVNALKSVSVTDAPLLVLLAATPYVAGAATFASVVPKPLPFGEVVRLMVGQSFLNRFTPANAGGMALRVRYLQKRGIDIGGAAAGVALTGVASGIGQIAVLATFAAWAGSSGSFSFSLPKASSVAVGAVVVAVLAGVVWLTPFGRRVVAKRLETTVRSVWKTLRTLSHEPGRFVTLFATTILSKVATIAAFAASCRALDLGIAFPRLGLLYLTASSLAAAAPTPGGVGAVEAALTAALTGAGAPPAEALSAVFLFRLATYWLPVPFGYISLRKLQHTILA